MAIYSAKVENRVHNNRTELSAVKDFKKLLHSYKKLFFKSIFTEEINF